MPALAVLNLVGIGLVTSFAMLEIAGMGVNVPPGLWLTAIGHDLMHLSPPFSAIFGLGLAVALSAAGLVARFVPVSPYLIDGCAGFVSSLTALLLMNEFLGVTPIGASRTLAGLLSVSLSGAMAALVFRMIRKRTAS